MKKRHESELDGPKLYNTAIVHGHQSPLARGVSLPPPDLSHEVGIGSCLCPQVLGFGDVEEDVHDVGGDVEGEGDLGAAVALGSVLVRLPLHLRLGHVFVMAFPWERPFPYLFLCHVISFLLLRALFQRWGLEAALVQDGVFLQEALLAFGKGRVEAAEDGGGVVETESPAAPSGTEQGEEEQQPGVGHRGGLSNGESKGRAEMGMSIPRGPRQSIVIPMSFHGHWLNLPGPPHVDSSPTSPLSLI